MPALWVPRDAGGVLAVAPGRGQVAPKPWAASTRIPALGPGPPGSDKALPLN